MTYEDIKKLVAENEDEIIDKMVDCYRDVLESNFRVQHTLYIWSDGEIIDHEDCSGGRTWLKPSWFEERELINLVTVGYGSGSLYDYDPELPDEDDPGYAEAAADLIDFLTSEYRREGAYYDLMSGVEQLRD